MVEIKQVLVVPQPQVGEHGDLTVAQGELDQLTTVFVVRIGSHFHRPLGEKRLRTVVLVPAVVPEHMLAVQLDAPGGLVIAGMQQQRFRLWRSLAGQRLTGGA